VIEFEEAFVTKSVTTVARGTFDELDSCLLKSAVCENARLVWTKNPDHPRINVQKLRIDGLLT
jgi:hypothetical protein